MTGLLFEPQNAEALGACMTRLAESRAMREQLGENLYEKASHEFSIDATVGKQIEIYQTILRRTAQPKKKKIRRAHLRRLRQKGNAGDDAILKAILAQLKAIDRDMPIYVMSHDPAQTRLCYHVGSVHVFDPFAFWPLMRKAKLFVSGGGSLIQNETSTRSLNYYLTTIRMAHAAGCRVMMYGCGIGPVSGEANRRHTARILNRCVDRITLREDLSRRELADMGVTEPKITVTADPALLLQRPPAARWTAIS